MVKRARLDPAVFTDYARDPEPADNWCEARGYCAWANKRLCYGQDYFGLLVPKAHVAEWVIACSANNSRAYPYGRTYEGLTCNGDQSNPAHGCISQLSGVGFCGPSSVGHLRNCRTSTNAPVDLSGNVAEWVDLCQNAPVHDALCQHRGGSYLDGPEALSCLAALSSPRDERSAATGFRCCVQLSDTELTTVQIAAHP